MKDYFWYEDTALGAKHLVSSKRPVQYRSSNHQTLYLLQNHE